MRLGRTFAAAVALAAGLLGCGWIIGTGRDVELRPDDGGGDEVGEFAESGIDGADAPAGDASDAGAAGDAPSEAARIDAGPIAFEQVVTSNAGRTTKGTVTFTKNVRAHSAIVLAFDADALVTLGGISDTLGNSYTVAVGPHDNASFRTWVAYALDSAAGACTITISLGTAPNAYFEIYAHEYSGIATANALDVTRVADGTSNAVDGVRSGTASLGANELVFAFSWSTDTVVAGTGFVGRSNLDNNVTEDRIAVTAGTYEGIATMQAGTAWTIAMLALRGN